MENQSSDVLQEAGKMIQTEGLASISSQKFKIPSLATCQEPNTKIQIEHPAMKSQSLSEFTPFPMLPVEIQHMIWKYATYNVSARIVELRYHGEIKSGKGCYSKNEIPKFLKVLLSTTKQSRLIAGKEYPLSFGTGGEKATVRFNFSKDTIYLGLEVRFLVSIVSYGEFEGREVKRLIWRIASDIIPHIAKSELDRIKFVAIDRRQSMLHTNRRAVTEARCPPLLSEILPAFRSLSRLTLVYARAHGIWEDDALPCKTKCAPVPQEACRECLHALRLTKENDCAVIMQAGTSATEDWPDATTYIGHHKIMKTIKGIYSEFSVPDVDYANKQA